MGSGRTRRGMAEIGHARPAEVPAGSPFPRDAAGRDWLTVTSPLLPELADLVPLLSDVLERRWVTNHGHYARALEEALVRYLAVRGLALSTSGTVGLDLAVRALIPDGEVVTTGYSFPATWHGLLENPRWRPVFVDVDEGFGIDPEAVAAAITPRTRGILAVHAYGLPCRLARLEGIARRHDLRLVYDAAHAFGVTVGERGIGSFGDASVFSFHATKVFNTLEGGCVTTGSAATLDRLRLLRNFGFRNENEVAAFGSNGKMDEVRAVFGLLNLERVDAAIETRGALARRYRERLEELGIEEIEIGIDPARHPGVRLNHAYFPVSVRPGGRVDRDGLAAWLRDRGIHARKYFFPTVTTAPLYEGLFVPGSLPRCERASRTTLCLPLHAAMTEADCERVVDAVAGAFGARGEARAA